MPPYGVHLIQLAVSRCPSVITPLFACHSRRTRHNGCAYYKIDLGTNREGMAATIANHLVADARKLRLDLLRARLLATVGALDTTDVLITHKIDLGTNREGMAATIANHHAAYAGKLQAITCECFDAPNVVTDLNPSQITLFHIRNTDAAATSTDRRARGRRRSAAAGLIADTITYVTATRTVNDSRIITITHQRLAGGENAEWLNRDPAGARVVGIRSSAVHLPDDRAARRLRSLD
jgi:hypothetical protein